MLQKKICIKIYKKEKKNSNKRLNLRNATDNKGFWKTVKPFLFKVTQFSDSKFSEPKVKLRLQTHLVISLKIPSIHLVSKKPQKF